MDSSESKDLSWKTETVYKVTLVQNKTMPTMNHLGNLQGCGTILLALIVGIKFAVQNSLAWYEKGGLASEIVPHQMQMTVQK